MLCAQAWKPSSQHAGDEVGEGAQGASRAAPGKSGLHAPCLTLSNPMDYSLPGSSVPGILQARILEWVAIAFSDKLGAQSDGLEGVPGLPGAPQDKMIRI